MRSSSLRPSNCMALNRSGIATTSLRQAAAAPAAVFSKCSISAVLPSCDTAAPATHHTQSADNQWVAVEPDSTCCHSLNMLGRKHAVLMCMQRTTNSMLWCGVSTAMHSRPVCYVLCAVCAELPLSHRP